MATGYEEIIGAMLDELGDEEIDSFASGLQLDDIAIGAEEIVGLVDPANDNSDFLRLMNATSGADLAPLARALTPQAPPQQGKAALQQMLKKLLFARNLDKNAVAVIDRPETKRRYAPLGFKIEGGNPVQPGQSGTATARPQKKYRIEKISIDSSIAPFFVITSFSIGIDNQFMSKDPLPATMFTEVATGKGILTDTAEVGNDIVFEFRSIDEKPRMFLAGCEGTMIR